jgi:transposase
VIGSTPLTAGATGVRIWLATAPLDMRRSFDALAEHVRVILSDNPMSGHLFVFRNRSGQRLKILWWDKDGYAIYYKRLERGTFQFPVAGEKSMAIGSGQLMKLLGGCAIQSGDGRVCQPAAGRS